MYISEAAAAAIRKGDAKRARGWKVSKITSRRVSSFTDALECFNDLLN